MKWGGLIENLLNLFSKKIGQNPKNEKMAKYEAYL